MNLLDKISMGAIIVGLAGAIGGCRYNLSLWSKSEEIKKEHIFREHKSLDLELYGYDVKMHDVLKIYKYDSEKWTMIEKNFDRYNEISSSPDFLSKKEELKHIRKNELFAEDFVLISSVLMLSGAFYILAKPKNFVNTLKNNQL